MPAECITIEYSQDGGVTWHDAGYTDADKQQLCSMKRNLGFIIGAAKGTTYVTPTTDYMTRVSITPNLKGY